MALEGISMNGRLACLPFKVEEKVDGKVSSGFATSARISKLLSTTVVMWEEQRKEGETTMGPGDTVYFRPEILGHTWAKETYEVEGQQVVLLPREFVVYCVEG